MEQNIMPWLYDQVEQNISQILKNRQFPNEFVDSYMSDIEKEHTKTVEQEKKRLEG